MKRVSVFALLMLMLLPAFVAAQQTNQQSTVPGNSLTASVAGTTWAGTDSDGDYYEYHFPNKWRLALQVSGRVL